MPHHQGKASDGINMADQRRHRVRIVPVTEANLSQAGNVHAAAWRESHRDVCSPEFVQAHTAARQTGYLREEMAQGKQLFLLLAESPAGVVSVDGSVIGNLYVHPEQQGRGYGCLLLRHAETCCTGTPSLWVLSRNEKAIAWYQRWGYIFSGRSKPLKNGLAELEMVRA